MQRRWTSPAAAFTSTIRFTQSHAAHSSIVTVSGLHHSSHPSHGTPLGKPGREQSFANGRWTRRARHMLVVAGLTRTHSPRIVKIRDRQSRCRKLVHACRSNLCPSREQDSARRQRSHVTGCMEHASDLSFTMQLYHGKNQQDQGDRGGPAWSSVHEWDTLAYHESRDHGITDAYGGRSGDTRRP